MLPRAIGIDAGAESLKIVIVEQHNSDLVVTDRIFAEHYKKPFEVTSKILSKLSLTDDDLICTTGKNLSQLQYRRIPVKVAMTKGIKYLFKELEDVSVLSISSQGYSLLELRKNQRTIFRKNPKCSEGTGNFFRQLINRMNIPIEKADEFTNNVESAVFLPGRCPVILKTKLTHLANNGENKQRILAGLCDTIADNALSLIKPGTTPSYVFLSGGVCRVSRIRQKIDTYLQNNNMKLISKDNDDFLFLEALGCAVTALDSGDNYENKNIYHNRNDDMIWGKLPSLSGSLHLINRLTSEEIIEGESNSVILGLDIGSTGSKITAFDFRLQKKIYDGYVSTNSNPVTSIKTLISNFIKEAHGKVNVYGFGVTGSGRDVANAMLSLFFGNNVVIVKNEITAHAKGALFYNGSVDTIFELGGQDAKFIRIQNGEIIDIAMNETCSAGTGSFIEEQGACFRRGLKIEELEKKAMESEYGISLGNHCSVFMANLLEQAISQGYEENCVIAGIYDSVAKNYLNRVKGNRNVGNVVFCQGMPFKSDALACAFAFNVGREIIIPPNPESTGSHGIAILASEVIDVKNSKPILLEEITKDYSLVKSSFLCNASNGCGKSGNFCEIDNITLQLNGVQKKAYWGGICSLWTKASSIEKALSIDSPDPFSEREYLVKSITKQLMFDKKQKSIAITDKFQLKELFPFFAVFFNELGFNIITENISTEDALKSAMNNCDVLFCSPMMIYYGIVHSFSKTDTDYIFLPILIDSLKQGDEKLSKMCPLVQGSADVIATSLSTAYKGKIVSPLVEIGNENLQSKEFINSCKNIANLFSCSKKVFAQAFKKAVSVQNHFFESCHSIGKRTIDYCKTNGIVPIVILGREYSIYNSLLNSGLPSILRSLGAMSIPIDCYPVDMKINDFNNVYWNCGQRILRAAKQIRSEDGVNAIYSSNYACGPDSFLNHFVLEIMQGKPFLFAENDIRSGDSGIKTRVEAFLDCVRTNMNKKECQSNLFNKNHFSAYKITLEQIINDRIKFLVPFIGPCSPVFAACLRGSGINAESLPPPDNFAICKAKRYTSGKECSPVNATLGSLLKYFEANKHKNDNYIYFMPGSDGPCRFGMYNVLHKIIIENLGLQNRIKIMSSGNDNFVQGVPKGLFTLVFSSLCIIDSMNTALHYVRPVEITQGISNKIFKNNQDKLIELLEQTDGFKIKTKDIFREILSGRLFGFAEILKNTCYELEKNRNDKNIPTVSIDGALYVRCDSFSNGFIVDALESNNIRAIPEPFFAWLEFLDYFEDMNTSPSPSTIINLLLKDRIKRVANNLLKTIPNVPLMPVISKEIGATKPYLNYDLMSESMLSIGSSIINKRERRLDGSILVSPHECMPSKIVEAQLMKISEKEDLYYKAINFSNEPLDKEIIDGIVYDLTQLATPDH